MSKIWKLFKSVLNFPIFNKYIEIKKIESQNHIYYKLSDKYFINIRNLLWQTSFTIRFFLIENHAIQIPYIYHTKHTAWEIPQSITNRRNRGKKERGKKKNGHGAPCVDGTPYSIDRIPLLRFPVDVLVISDEKGAVELIVGEEGCYVGHARQIMQEETVKVWCLGGFGRIMRWWNLLR